MKRFHSYGPVDCEQHFCVKRRELVEECLDYIVGDPDKGGHYFTIWGPRQSGKTWLIRETVKEIRAAYGQRFVVGTMSMQGVVLKDNEPDEMFLQRVPMLMRRVFGLDVQTPARWEDWASIFLSEIGIFKKPVILFIDEFDSLPSQVIDPLVGLFRDIYLDREHFCLHGLALIGVRAVLGIESDRGSPFNIQRSLHVPNLTEDEVKEMFRQYQEESGQGIEEAVVTKVFDVTRGQPGLVSWFGELLTEKFNPGKDKTIGMKTWEKTYMRACTTEWNNTVLNLIKKARGEYQSHVLELFGHSDMPFTLDSDWCNYMYLHGIIDHETGIDSKGENIEICRFSSPFVQLRIYNALVFDLVGDRTPILALEPLDDLSDVFDRPILDVPALMPRYKDYLKRLKAKGLNPWKEQPRRTDMHLTEAVGHFHLYAWLREAVGKYCAISAEFPTGNGKVDLHLRCDGKEGIIEVKSFTDSRQAKEAVKQAAGYAASLGLDAVTVVLFVPVDDEAVLEKLSGEETAEDVHVTVCAIGWA